MTLEMGKPVAESKAEIAYGAEFLRWFSEQTVRIDGRYAVAPSGQGRLLTMKQPVGPCLLITPWNFPLAMGTRKIGPAIAAGCTMVVKPAKQTPLSMLALGGIFEEAGLPAGVLNIVTTSQSGAVTDPLFDDPRLRKVSFTGSTEVGRTLMEQASQNLLRLSMELGGNAPFIVFEDADMDAAVQGALIAKMRNIGEACTAANRFYVHAEVVDEFARRLADRMDALRIGRGTEDGVQVGPLIEAKAREKVQRLVDDAVARGARVLVGGEPVGGPGRAPPTIARPPRGPPCAHASLPWRADGGASQAARAPRAGRRPPGRLRQRARASRSVRLPGPGDHSSYGHRLADVLALHALVEGHAQGPVADVRHDSPPGGRVGDGVIDFGPISAAVLSAGYQGDVEVEIFNAAVWDSPPDETAATVAERFPAVFGG